MKQEGYNQEAIQSMNRTLILQYLQQEKMCSRVRLAQLSGLKQATITNIINDFISWGIVEEMGLMGGQRGRRAIAIRLEQERFAVIGVRLARQFFDVGLFTLSGELVGERVRTPITDNAPQAVLDGIARSVLAMIHAASGRQILAVGVAVPGPYYAKEGIIEDVFPGWEKICVPEELRSQIPLPVCMEHDANAGVLAERLLGDHDRKYETIVYLAIGQGIGAGIYHNGQIFRGSTGIAGEIGHISINLDGPVCSCGNRGCLTAYASTIALTNRINLARQKIDSAAKLLTWQDLTGDSGDAPENDPVIREEFDRNIRYLAAGINSLIYSYNPDLIIIGDEILALDKKIADDLADRLIYLKRHSDKKKVLVRASSFDMDPAFVGAAEVAIDYVFHHLGVFWQ